MFSLKLYSSPCLKHQDLIELTRDVLRVTQNRRDNECGATNDNKYKKVINSINNEWQLSGYKTMSLYSDHFDWS